MNIKSLGMTLAALAVGAVLGIAGLHTIQAATATPASNLIQNLANKFNTTTDNVKSVFDQTRQQNQDARQKQIEDNLTQAVKDGKITDAQKTTILSKLADIRTKMQAAQSARQDLKQWATDNKVDLSTLLPAGHRLVHRFGL